MLNGLSEGYDQNRASVSTYLYGVARRRTRRTFLRDRRFVALDDSARGASPIDPRNVSDDLARDEDVQRLRRAILSLPSRYREVIVLCDLQDLSYCDAADAIGCAVGTVRSRLHRARQLLIDKMRRESSRVELSSRPTVKCPV